MQPELQDDRDDDRAHWEAWCECYPCPSCGSYYSLGASAPDLPEYLVSYGTDQEIEAWEHEHNYNVVSCSVCGWSEEDE